MHLLKASSQKNLINVQACYKLAAAPWMLHEAGEVFAYAQAASGMLAVGQVL